MAPCDDGIGRVTARPDGGHYEGAGEEAVIDTLLLDPAPSWIGPTARRGVTRS
jgi:hypothetical protein